MTTAAQIAESLDVLLRVREIPDYPQAHNGLQLDAPHDITRVAAAVDYSLRTIEGALASGANLLLVHHGMFWSGVQPLRGRPYERIARAIGGGLAVYASHLPLDVHPEIGNNALLARELDLDPSGGFARHQTIDVGVRGECERSTRSIVDRARALSSRHGGSAVATPFTDDRVTRRWAICTGAGASSDTLREAIALGIDTLIVGEGPHHTAVEAIDHDIVVVYAGHYATETLGVQALARQIEKQFGLPWTFVEVPTGL